MTRPEHRRSCSPRTVRHDLASVSVLDLLWRSQPGCVGMCLPESSRDGQTYSFMVANSKLQRFPALSLHQHLRDARCGDRRREQVALAEVALKYLQQVHLRLIFDSFGDHPHAQTMSQGNDA